MSITRQNEKDPRKISHAFLEEEKELFSITDINKDIKEKSIKKDQHGITHITYNRFVSGLRVEGMEIKMHIGDPGKIVSVNGEIIQLSTQMLDVINKSLDGGQSETDIDKTINDDLRISGLPDSVKRKIIIEKIVTLSAPFVVWTADVILIKGGGRWKYLLDAISGQIVDKQNAMKYDNADRSTLGVLHGNDKRPKAPLEDVKDAVTQ